MTKPNQEIGEGQENESENRGDEPWHHEHLPLLLAGGMFGLIAFFVLLSLLSSH